MNLFAHSLLSKHIFLRYTKNGHCVKLTVLSKHPFLQDVTSGSCGLPRARTLRKERELKRFVDSLKPDIASFTYFDEQFQRYCPVKSARKFPEPDSGSLLLPFHFMFYSRVATIYASVSDTEAFLPSPVY